MVCVPHVCLSCLQEAPQQQQQLPLPQLAQLARHTAHLGHQAHTLQGTKSAGQRTHLHTGPSRPEGDQAARQARTLQTAGVRGASDHGHWCAACLRLSEQGPGHPADGGAAASGWPRIQPVLVCIPGPARAPMLC